MAKVLIALSVRPKPIAIAVAAALGARPKRTIVKKSLIKRGKPVASGYTKE